MMLGSRPADEAVHLGRRLDERPAVGVEGGPTARRDDLRRQGMDRRPNSAAQPASVIAGVPGSSARPAHTSRSGETSSAMHEHLATAVAKEA